MTDSVQEQLLGHLLDALDDCERESIDAQFKSDPQLRRQREEVVRLLAPLDLAREDFPPPPDLADRTCRFVFSQRKTPRSASASTTRRSMTPDSAPPSGTGRIGWVDVAMAVGVFFAAALITVPAIQHSRFLARRTSCEDNLRQLGTALTEHSESNQGYFPQVPAEGKLAAAGIYAPVLLGDGFLTEANRVVCADSPRAGEKDFRVPSLDEIRSASGEKLAQLRDRMGGSYGYNLGYIENGQYRGTKNLRRPDFALMSDAPSLLPGGQTVNHGGRGQNVLFEDGRVRFLPTPKPPGFSDDFFHNDVGQVAAGVRRDDSVIGSSSSPPIIYVNR